MLSKSILFLSDMNMLPRSSSRTMSSSSSSSDDSSQADGKRYQYSSINLSNLTCLEHDWEVYLKQTNSEAAPANCFRQVNKYKEICCTDNFSE